MENTPEPRLELPEPFFIVADCGHEVYDGENLFEWPDYINGKWRYSHICPDCFTAKFNEIPLDELARILSLNFREIHKPGTHF